MELDEASLLPPNGPADEARQRERSAGPAQAAMLFERRMRQALLVFAIGLLGAHLEAVAAIGRLDIIRLLAAEVENPLYRRRDVFMEAVGELDDEDRALTGRTQQTASDRAPGFSADLFEDDIHEHEASIECPVRKRPNLFEPRIFGKPISCHSAPVVLMWDFGLTKGERMRSNEESGSKWPVGNTMIRITFWGVRGSVPAPGPQTSHFGGNTSCVEMRCGEARIIFDAGTGIRLLGSSMLASMPTEAHLFFSHVHWDHIQGFPFFAPAFIPGNTFHLYGAKTSKGDIESAMRGQMQAPFFPISVDDMKSELHFHTIAAGESIEIPGGARVTAASGTHPGGVLAYRVDYAGASAVYATDTEHKPGRIDKRLLELARGADVLIYDSMYTPEEYRGESTGFSRVGWGHSTFEAGALLAREADIGRYILFHHDPNQTDEDVREKERRARELFENADCAYEGMSLEITAGRVAQAAG